MAFNFLKVPVSPVFPFLEALFSVFFSLSYRVEWTEGFSFISLILSENMYIHSTTWVHICFCIADFNWGLNTSPLCSGIMFGDTSRFKHKHSSRCLGCLGLVFNLSWNNWQYLSNSYTYKHHTDEWSPILLSFNATDNQPNLKDTFTPNLSLLSYWTLSYSTDTLMRKNHRYESLNSLTKLTNLELLGKVRHGKGLEPTDC